MHPLLLQALSQAVILIPDHPEVAGDVALDLVREHDLRAIVGVGLVQDGLDAARMQGTAQQRRALHSGLAAGVHEVVVRLLHHEGVLPLQLGRVLLLGRALVRGELV